MALDRGSRFGAYEIGDSIGAGGMGEVYRATDTALDREVAIKVLPESFAADTERVARFEKEAKALAALNHPNIAQIHGLEHSGDVTALVMELIEGPTLAERLEQGALPVNEAMSIAMQVADALEAAHAHGIIHRDLKPANIKLTPQGVVKLVDFGIAKSIDIRSASGDQAASYVTPSVTQTGVILGTAAYMSPEQARGKPVDERTDIWAFGVVLYEMLTGQPAFGGEDVTVTLARVLERHTDMSTLPAAISPAVRQTLQLCLQKNVKKRIADIRDVRLALEGEFESTSSAPAAPSFARRAVPIAAGLVIGGILIGGLVWALRSPAPPPRPVSRLLVTPPADAPLSALGGYDAMISPDGSQLAYYAQVEGNSRVELYLRDLDSLEVRRLPGTEVMTTGGNMLPFYSPDGANIGFRSPGQGLMRVAVAGGPPIRILPDDVIDNPQYLGAAWASDGTLIFSTGEGLYRVSAGGGGTPVRLTAKPESENTRYVAPVLLPGERGVIYTIDDARIMLLDLESGEERVLVENGKNPFYSPSGHLVFARGSTLMAMPLDLETMTVSGDPVALFDGIRYPGGGTATDFAVSASGTLVYIRGTMNDTLLGELDWVDRDGRVVAPVLSDTIENPRDPRLSPDGTRLAVTTGSFSDGDVWIYDLAGRPPIPLAIEGFNRLPVWSPDGADVAFASNQTGLYSVYMLPADGSVLDLGTALPDSGPMGPMDWLDDNTLLATATTGNGDVVAMNLDEKSGWRDIVATPDTEIDPAVSPNGRWLAYSSTRTGAAEIWVRAYPDGVPVRVSRNGGIEPRWSRDGKELFFRQGTTMYAVKVKSDSEFTFEPATALFSGGYFLDSNLFVRSYDVAADGRFLMIQPSADSQNGQGSESIVVVQNFDEELKARVPTP
jgi:Tol biopolymer transport system component